MKLKFVLLGLLAATGNALALAQPNLDAPVGVRPCCAFGYDLKAQVGSLPVPFFSLDNLVSASDVGRHHYNDGSESVSKSLLGLADEKNGLVYTLHGGFIDTAHVRDTADYTYYLYTLNRQNLGKSALVTLPSELRKRRLVWLPQSQALSADERITRSIEAAALSAYQLAQWHEIAQWFGLVSVSGFQELASAFSPEDLYSNMLGAKLAAQVIKGQPSLSKAQFAAKMDAALNQAMDELGAQPHAVTKAKMKQLDGQWWDSQRRLPDKWLVRHRNYDMGLTRHPEQSSTPTSLTLNSSFSDGTPIEQWLRLELVMVQPIKAFSKLGDEWQHNPVWMPADFQTLADFAKHYDDNTRPALTKKPR